ncbi:MAG: mechanosensitive ion channel family protein [Candidatus Izemoplasma sp.]
MEDLGTMINDLILKINGISDQIATLITASIVILLWIFIGYIIIFVMKHSLKKVFKIRPNDKRTLTIGKLINSITKYVVSFVISLIILTELGIDITPLLASAGVLGLAIGFGAQSIVKDFISGFFIIFENSFNVGDTIEISGFKGEVIEMGLRTTRILNWRGEIKILTNGSIRDIINYSKSFSVAVVSFGVSYDTNIDKLKLLLVPFLDEIKRNNANIIETPSFSGVTGLEDSSIMLRITAKTNSNTHYQIERDIRKKVVELLKFNNIEIPFPQIVIHNNEN